MILTEEQTKELKEASAPLMKFLADNFHPHVKCIAESDSVEIMEGLALVIDRQFIKD